MWWIFLFCLCRGVQLKWFEGLCQWNWEEWVWDMWGVQMCFCCLEDENMMIRVPFRGNLGCGHRWWWTLIDLECFLGNIWYFLECFFVVVEILGMYSVLIGRSARISSRLMIFGEFKMELGHRRLNSVDIIKFFDQLLIPEYNLS